jgi:hypothetical protein
MNVCWEEDHTKEKAGKKLETQYTVDKHTLAKKTFPKDTLKKQLIL